MKVYQLNFSPNSMDCLNKLDRLEQMKVLEHFSQLTPNDLKNGNEDLGKFQRQGHTFYRLRAGQYRIYFEVNDHEHSLMAHYILTQHSLTDFVMRFKLPLPDALLLEKHPSFWDYIENLRK